jgi:hypothetical protein
MFVPGQEKGLAIGSRKVCDSIIILLILSSFVSKSTVKLTTNIISYYKLLDASSPSISPISSGNQSPATGKKKQNCISETLSTVKFAEN